MTISGKARLAGVFGWPVSHSKSPRLHGYWLQHYHVDGAYVPMPVHPDNIVSALRALPLLGFSGVNVTLPHKETVFAAVDHRTARAKRIGAVNTVIVQDDGSLLGDNTDGFGFLENLRHSVTDFSATHGPAVVLGAGGAARAIIVALLEDGAPVVHVVNRTLERARSLADELSDDQSGRVCAHGTDALMTVLEEAALLVNTTSLGMTGQPSLDIDLTPLPKTAVVNDIVYVPLETDLLKSARDRGNPAVDGLGMLLHQGRPGFSAWFGHDPEVTPALRHVMLQD